MHERAGTPATESDLIDVEALLRAYYDLHPDVSIPEQRVVFGTRGHRGSSAQDGVQRGPHPRDPCRPSSTTATARASPVRLFIGADTHALERPGADDGALDVLVANGVWCCPTSTTTTADSGLSHAIPSGTTTREAARARPTASSRHPAGHPPQDGGFKYNPPHGGPADSDATS